MTWEPEVENSIVNLHFFAAHPHHRMSGGTVHEHVKEAFDECMKRSGSAVRMNPVILNGSKLDGPLPEGVAIQETEGLESRIRRMAQLGRMMKADRDLNLLWFDSEALDAQPDACTNSGNC